MTTYQIVWFIIAGLSALLFVYSYRKRAYRFIWNVSGRKLRIRLVLMRMNMVTTWRRDSFRRKRKLALRFAAAMLVIGAIIGVYQLRQPRKVLVKVGEWSEVVQRDDIIDIDRHVDGRSYIGLDKNKEPLEDPYTYPSGARMHCPDTATNMQFRAEVSEYYVTIRGPLGSKPDHLFGQIRKVLVTASGPSEVIALDELMGVDQVAGRKIICLDDKGKAAGSEIDFPKGDFQVPHWVKKIRLLARGEPYVATVIKG